MTILTGAFGPQPRGAIIGILGGLGGLTVAGGPLIGGVVTEGLDWHWIFWLNVPVGVAAVALSRARLPESHGPEAGLDLPALALLTGGAASLVWGPGAGERVRLGRADDPRRARLRALLVAGFAAWEGHAATPMLPLRLLRIRDFTAANATALLMTGALGAAVFLIAQYCQLVLGYSPLGTGCASSPGRQPPANRSGSRADLRPGRATPRAGRGHRRASRRAGLVRLAIGTAPRYATMVAPLLVAAPASPWRCQPPRPRR